MRTILAFPAQFAVLFYRWCISPFLPVACRFHPTCSHYAMDAIKAHGLVRGSLLTAYRLLRCNPWGGSGHDPVPPAQCETHFQKNERL